MSATATALIKELRARKVLDEQIGTTQDASELDIRAASMIESLLFQLGARIGVARAEAAEKLTG